MSTPFQSDTSPVQRTALGAESEEAITPDAREENAREGAISIFWDFVQLLVRLRDRF